MILILRRTRKKNVSPRWDLNPRPSVITEGRGFKSHLGLGFFFRVLLKINIMLLLFHLYYTILKLQVVFLGVFFCLFEVRKVR